MQALKGIFYTFFNANTKAQKQQKDVLVSMTTHETSINPFHVPDSSSFEDRPSNVAEAEENDDQFGHLERKPKIPSKHIGIGVIVEEKHEHSIDSADAPEEDATESSKKTHLAEL